MLIEPICSTFAGVSKTKYVSGPSRLVFREGNYKKGRRTYKMIVIVDQTVMSGTPASAFWRTRKARSEA